MNLRIENAHSLNRFLEAQELDYEIAKKELIRGKKQSHWIWYIFPQLKGLGRSEINYYYGLDNSNEVREYYNNEILRNRLLELTNILLSYNYNSLFPVLEYDDVKVKSCMTVFYLVTKEEVFLKVLNKYFNGELDARTVQLLENESK